MRWVLLLTALLLAPLPAFGWVFGNDGGGVWQHRIEITVPAANVDANLTNFPVYVDASDLPADFHTNVKTDACDVRWTTSDGVTETAGYPLTYDAGTDTGEFYFLAPSLSSSVDNTFYIYYGNASATCYLTTDTHGREAVWPDFEFVSHSGSWGNILGADGTAISIDGIPSPLPTVGDSTGIAGNATGYNIGGNVGQGFEITDPAVHVDGFYISSFVNYSSVAGADFMYLWQHGNSSDSLLEYYRPYESESGNGTYPRMRAMVNDNDFGTYADQWATTRTPQTGVWQHIAQYGQPGGSRRGYYNGSPLGGAISLPAGWNPSTPLVVAAGGIGTAGYTQDRDTSGVYDEFRLRLTVPANVDAWAALEHDNYTSTVYSFGIQETNDGSPVAAFSATPLSGIAPMTANFTDESTSTPTSWSWDVDNDGTPDYTTQNPQHTYSTPGTYTVSLTVTNANGSGTLTKTDYITVTEATECSTIADTLANDGDPATSLVGCWTPAKTFNDGGTLADSYLDIHDGSHDLTVVGTAPTLGANGWVLPGDGGLNTGWPIVAGTDSIIVIVDPNDTPVDGRTFGRRGATPTTEAIWNIPNHLTVGNAYGISDGTNSSVFNQYTAVTTQSAVGLRGFQPWKDGADLGSPIASSNPPASSIPLYLGAHNNNGTIDQEMLAGSTIGAAVAIAGTPSEATMASIEQELWNSMSVGSPPVADFSGTPTTGTVPFTVNFTDLSTADPGVPITAWSWDIDGGGEDYTTQNPSHEYTVPGTYTVSLTVTNADGSNNETKVAYITANASAPEMRLEITNTTRSYRPSFEGTNTDGFFNNFQPLD